MDFNYSFYDYMGNAEAMFAEFDELVRMSKSELIEELEDIISQSWRSTEFFSLFDDLRAGKDALDEIEWIAYRGKLTEYNRFELICNAIRTKK